MASDLYSTPLKVPPFDGKPVDLLGGQHLKSLSAELGGLGTCSLLYFLNPP